MEISFLDLLCCFLVYSFLGWVFETTVLFLRTKKLGSRGFFSLPLCPDYGIIVVILIILYSRVNATDYIIKYIMALVVSGIGIYMAGSLTELLTGHTMWDYRKTSLFSGEKWPMLYGMLEALIFMTAETLIQPWLSAGLRYVPHLVKLIFCAVLCGALVVDFVLIEMAVRKRRPPGEVDKFLTETEKGTSDIEQAISSRIWRRLTRTYPELKTQPNAKLPNFAQGICPYKLIWVFLISSLLGDLIETCFVRLTGGVWMSRSSLIYGPFSVVWGFGAVLLTLVLHPLSQKEDRYIFLGGFLIGGVYEYSCSVFTEVFLHTTFWNYSKMPLNIGGRTNVLYCFFWGILALIWLKVLYPPLSDIIEKIPTFVGTVLTWAILLALIFDTALSAAVLIRYSDRQKDPTAYNIFEALLDENYPDSVVQRRWRNMHLAGTTNLSGSPSAESDTSDTPASDDDNVASPSSATKTSLNINEPSYTLVYFN